MSSFCNGIVDSDIFPVDLHTGALIFGSFGVISVLKIYKRKSSGPSRLLKQYKNQIKVPKNLNFARLLQYFK